MIDVVSSDVFHLCTGGVRVIDAEAPFQTNEHGDKWCSNCGERLLTTTKEEVAVTDKLALYDNVLGVFADLDDGGLTDDEALAQIRGLVGAKKPLPGVVTMIGTLPFTITIDTVTKEVTEFEINYDFPNFERKIETRKEGAEIEVDDTTMTELIEAADNSTGSWPEPERM